MASRSKQRPITSRIYALLLGMLLLLYVCCAAFWPLPTVQAISSPPTIPLGSKATITWPGYGQSAIGAEGFGEVLATNGEQKTVPIASITKIVTALVVLDKNPIRNGSGETITFTTEDVAIYEQYAANDGSIVYVENGLELSQYQVLQATLIASANNYADSLAIWSYGSMSAYTKAANAFLSKHKLGNTIVADASGFSANSKSTASDLVKLGQLALKNTVITDIVSQKSATIDGIGTIYSTNSLLGKSGVIGIKTGTTDEAGSCLLYAASFMVGDRKITLVGATLGAQNHTELASDIRTIIATSSSGFQAVTLITKGQPLAAYTAAWGQSSEAVAKSDVRTVVWSDSVIKTSITTDEVITVKNGQELGKITFSIGTNNLDSRLSSNASIEKPSLIWRLFNPHKLF